MTVLRLSEAKAHLGDYARRVSRGDSFILAYRNQLLAKLVPVEDEPAGLKPIVGLMDGAAEIPDDFNAVSELCFLLRLGPVSSSWGPAK